MIIAVDFDDTLAVTDYPKIIEPKMNVIQFCKRRQAVGDTIILWTCRNGTALSEAVKWCGEQGLFFDYVNESPPEMVDKYGESRKVYADIYLDDHNWLLCEIS